MQFVNCSLCSIYNTSVDHQVHVINLGDLLAKYLMVIKEMVLDFDLVPLLADPALS